MTMLNSLSDFLTHPAAPKRKAKIIVLGGVSLSVLALACVLGYWVIRPFDAPEAEPTSDHIRSQASTELISGSGKVQVLKAGAADWQEIRAGALLSEGDLVRTDATGEASIRYPSGTTVTIPAGTALVVQSTGSGSMEIVMPPDTSESSAQDGAASDPAMGSAGPQAEKTIRPYLKMQRIVPFGRSLELIGHVEAGSSLTVNSEQVEVEGDGFFKHFTKPFPPAAGEVRLVLKVTDLAGRTNTVTTTYDFRLHEED